MLISRGKMAATSPNRAANADTCTAALYPGLSPQPTVVTPGYTDVSTAIKAQLHRRAHTAHKGGGGVHLKCPARLTEEAVPLSLQDTYYIRPLYEDWQT